MGTVSGAVHASGGGIVLRSGSSPSIHNARSWIAKLYGVGLRRNGSGTCLPLRTRFPFSMATWSPGTAITRLKNGAFAAIGGTKTTISPRCGVLFRYAKRSTRNVSWSGIAGAIEPAVAVYVR